MPRIPKSELPWEGRGGNELIDPHAPLEFDQFPAADGRARVLFLFAAAEVEAVTSDPDYMGDEPRALIWMPVDHAALPGGDGDACYTVRVEPREAAMRIAQKRRQLARLSRGKAAP